MYTSNQAMDQLVPTTMSSQEKVRQVEVLSILVHVPLPSRVNSVPSVVVSSPSSVVNVLVLISMTNKMDIQMLMVCTCKGGRYHFIPYTKYLFHFKRNKYV